MILCPGFKRNGKNAGENPPNAGYRSKPNVPDVNIAAAVLFIGATTFILSAIGLKVGNVFGTKYKSKAELAGGVILILIGTKILLEHLGVINF